MSDAWYLDPALRYYTADDLWRMFGAEDPYSSRGEVAVPAPADPGIVPLVPSPYSSLQESAGDPTESEGSPTESDGSGVGAAGTDPASGQDYTSGLYHGEVPSRAEDPVHTGDPYADDRTDQHQTSRNITSFLNPNPFANTNLSGILSTLGGLAVPGLGFLSGINAIGRSPQLTGMLSGMATDFGDFVDSMFGGPMPTNALGQVAKYGWGNKTIDAYGNTVNSPKNLASRLSFDPQRGKFVTERTTAKPGRVMTFTEKPDAVVISTDPTVDPTDYSGRQTSMVTDNPDDHYGIGDYGEYGGLGDAVGTDDYGIGDYGEYGGLGYGGGSEFGYRQGGHVGFQQGGLASFGLQKTPPFMRRPLNGNTTLYQQGGLASFGLQKTPPFMRRPIV